MRYLAAFLLLLAAPALGQVPGGGYTVSSTPVMVVPAANGPRFFLRIMNVSPEGGAILWCSRQTNNPPAAGAGSYQILPGQFEQIGPVSSQQGALAFAGLPVWCVATGGDALVTVDAY